LSLDDNKKQTEEPLINLMTTLLYGTAACMSTILAYWCSQVKIKQPYHKRKMRLSAGLSLALLSTAANIACGFSLKPSATKNVVNTSIQNDSILARKPFVGATSSLTQMKKFENVRGGSVQAASTAGQESESTSSLGNTVASFWAAGGFVMILAKSIKRVLPIALEPFGKGAVAPLSTLQLG
jgi:hypothetical protein